MVHIILENSFHILQAAVTILIYDYLLAFMFMSHFINSILYLKIITSVLFFSMVVLIAISLILDSMQTHSILMLI